MLADCVGAQAYLLAEDEDFLFLAQVQRSESGGRVYGKGGGGF